MDFPPSSSTTNVKRAAPVTLAAVAVLPLPSLIEFALTVPEIFAMELEKPSIACLWHLYGDGSSKFVVMKLEVICVPVMSGSTILPFSTSSMVVTKPTWMLPLYCDKLPATST